MSLLKKLVDLLTQHVNDAVPVAESEIRQFARERGLLLRDDHLQFLMKFGAEPGKRLHAFWAYGGDFDFRTLKDEYLDDLFLSDGGQPPPGCTYFGSDFVGSSFCIDYESGKIFVYDGGKRYSLVHEGIDGFLLSALLAAYREKAGFRMVQEQNLAPEYITEFQLENQKNKIAGATRFEMTYQDIDKPIVDCEYYFAQQRLISLFLPRINSITTLSGGGLENLKP